MLRIISDGTWKLDGGRLFGETPKVDWDWEWRAVIDRRNRVTLGLNCLLLDTPAGKVLINTGVGPDAKGDERRADWYGLVPSRLLKGLKAHGVSPKEISMVILTDLRFINAGGSTRVNRAGDIVPTFPRARYIVQREALGEALGESLKDASERSPWHPNPDAIITPLRARGQMSIVDGDCEITSGVSVRKTSGFSRGQQVVFIRDGGDRVAFLGTVVPTRFHLNEACIPALARYAEVASKEKAEILAKVAEEGWLVVFPWEARTSAAAGYVFEVRNLEGSRKTIEFRPVDLSATLRSVLVS